MAKSAWVSTVLRIENPWGHEEHFALVATAVRRSTSIRVTREAVHLRPGTRHQMTALEDSVVLEASTTELDDMVRHEDRYGRS